MDLLALAVRVAEGGAALAQDAREQAITQVRTKSTDTDVVTAGDQAVERYILGELAAARPDDAVLSEESGALGDPAGAAVRWILDPIDGTVNYLYGVPYYAVSLAAEVDGVVVAGVVRNAATGEQWTAVRGAGAYKGEHGRGRRLTGSTETELGSRSSPPDSATTPARRAHQARVLAGTADQIRDIRRFGAAALDLCAAAEGIVDGYYEKGLNLWDHRRRWAGRHRGWPGRQRGRRRPAGRTARRRAAARSTARCVPYSRILVQRTDRDDPRSPDRPRHQPR